MVDGEENAWMGKEKGGERRAGDEEEMRERGEKLVDEEEKARMGEEE